MQVVGTMFFKDKKLLIDKPRQRATHQMIGGRVEDGETPLQAAVRECYEELQISSLDESLFELIMDFDEIATSDKNLKIHFFVFKYNGEFVEDPQTSEEIESFMWYDSSCGTEILSNTLRNEVVPYCLRNKLIN